MSDLPAAIRAELKSGANAGYEPDEDRLKAIADALAGKLKDAKDARAQSGIEQVWMDAEEAYIGMDDLNRHEYNAAAWTKSTSLNGPLQSNTGRPDPSKSTVFSRLTSRYVDAGSAKITEILIATDDPSFSITETPIPDLIAAKDDKRHVIDDRTGQPMMRPLKPGEVAPPTPIPNATLPVPQPIPVPLGPPSGPGTVPVASQAIGANGGPPMAPEQPPQPPLAPLTVADLAEEHIELARTKAKAAQTQIYDWMVEGRFQSEARLVLQDAARIGVGVLKAPFAMVTRAMALVDEQTLEVQEKVIPAVKWCDPWNIFPSAGCGERLTGAEDIFERDYLAESELEKLKDQPGYIPSAIMAAIKIGPGGPDGESTPVRLDETQRKKRYEAWYFTGTLKRSDMNVLRMAADRTIDQGDDDERIFAIVTMVNNIIIKASFNPLESGKVNYFNFPWSRRANSWAGIGVAEQIKTPQRILNAATRSMLNNAGMSGGVQIIIDQGGIRPANTEWDVTPNKIWYRTEDAAGDDVKNAFNVFEIPNVTDAMLKIINYALQLAEESTSIPLVTQGQSGETAPKTLGGMQLQDNNANQLLRAIGYTWDDYVMEPMVQLYYEWLLLDPEVKSDAKGDFKIQAHGSSALVERAIYNTTLQQMTPMVENPIFGANPRRWFKELLKAEHIDPELVCNTPEEQQKIDAVPPPGAPAVQAAQIRAQVDQAKIAQDAKDNDADRQVELHDIAAKVNRDGLTAQQEAARTQADTSVDMQKMQLQRDIALMQYALQNKLSIADAQTQLAQTAMKLNVEKDLAFANHVADLHKHHNPVPQPMKPPVEVPGRAANGQQFSQSNGA